MRAELRLARPALPARPTLQSVDEPSAQAPMARQPLVVLRQPFAVVLTRALLEVRPEPELLELRARLPQTPPQQARPLVRQPEGEHLVVPRLYRPLEVEEGPAELPMREHARVKPHEPPHRELHRKQEVAMLEARPLQLRFETPDEELEQPERVVLLQPVQRELVLTPPDILSPQEPEPVVLPREQTPPVEQLKHELVPAPRVADERPPVEEPLEPTQPQSPPVLQVREPKLCKSTLEPPPQQRSVVLTASQVPTTLRPQLQVEPAPLPPQHQPRLLLLTLHTPEVARLEELLDTESSLS